MVQNMKDNAGSILVCLLEILVGVLLLIDPIGFTSSIIILIGIVLMLFGCVCVIRYFHAEPLNATREMSLVQGLIGITAGLFCVLRYNWFIIAFPVLTILYGIAVLVTGFYKIQITTDMLRLRKSHWGWMAVSAVLALALAAIILWNPFTSSVLLWDFIAISLIVEAVFDIVTIIMTMRKER